MADDFKTQLQKWRELERLAFAAEQELKALGRLGSSPDVAEKFREAARLRKEADDYLHRIIGIPRKDLLR